MRVFITLLYANLAIGNTIAKYFDLKLSKAQKYNFII